MSSKSHPRCTCREVAQFDELFDLKDELPVFGKAFRLFLNDSDWRSGRFFTRHPFSIHSLSMRSHPKNPWIKNGRPARLLVFFSRHQIPVLSRLYMHFFGCDIGCALPNTIFLPHPMGIVVHGGTKIGDNVVIGHQVTLGGRDLTGAAPDVGDGVYIGAGAKILGGIHIGRGATVGANAVVTKDVPAGATVVGANRILSNRSHYALD